MRRTSWLLLILSLGTAPASAQTPGNPPRAQLPVFQPDGTHPPMKGLRPESLVTFDYRQAELRWSDQHWQLIAGDVWLKDFGRREADARAALRTIRNLHLTQRGTVGTPPVMEYWLADAAAPQSFGGAGRVETLDLTSLRVELVEGQWSLRDNRHRLFAFGPRREDADQALAVIRHYGFTRLGVIGPATPTMTYFLGGDSSMSHSPLRAANDIKAGAMPQQPSESGSDPKASPSQKAEKSQQSTAEAPERLTFDYRQVQVRHEQNEWKLVFGTHVFANFGEDHYAAQQALGLFQHYRFTEQFLIGRPIPTFTYFLVAGQAPRGLQFGLPAETFLPEAVVVRQAGGQWVVCEGERPLISFGDKEEEARQLVSAIRRFRFDHLCRLGSGPGRSLTFLIRDR